MMFNLICTVLNDMGYVIFNEEKDFSISDYIIDSFQFITFILNLEERLNIQLSDDFLSDEILKSACGLANKLSSYCQSDK